MLVRYTRTRVSGAEMESPGEIDRLRNELIVLRAENALLRQAVDHLKARMTDLIVEAHTAEVRNDAQTAPDLKGKKAIYWG